MPLLQNKKEGAKIMEKNTTKNVGRIRVSLQSRVALLLAEKKATQVTFVRHDGSKIIQSISDSFIKDKKVSDIVDDLHAINHDLKCKYFTI